MRASKRPDPVPESRSGRFFAPSLIAPDPFADLGDRGADLCPART